MEIEQTSVITFAIKTLSCTLTSFQFLTSVSMYRHCHIHIYSSHLSSVIQSSTVHLVSSQLIVMKCYRFTMEASHSKNTAWTVQGWRNLKSKQKASWHSQVTDSNDVLVLCKQSKPWGQTDRTDATITASVCFTTLYKSLVHHNQMGVCSERKICSSTNIQLSFISRAQHTDTQQWCCNEYCSQCNH